MTDQTPITTAQSVQTGPRLNEAAPAFDAPTTHGRKTLEDYRGQWLVLFSHPADFTPVCTTEFIGFAKRHEDFEAANTALLGLSIDSHYSHIAWVLNIKEKFGVDIRFPIIADLNMAVAQAYGMIQPGASDTAAVRATFIIDPEGVLRAMVYYPMNAGRSVDEIYRLLIALQTADENACAMPENWKPGDAVIVPTPKTPEEAAARAGEGYDTVDWYFSTRHL
ncbi:peroxiredoxin [Tropicibacter naphthalenivorans]|uniref:Peroxiredoxin n=1 Tax=Tropicibacter naphthalenivorans TaxID=441103 RepID=A0A0P1GKN2_9RHOB|nr:peroxiredoxin [Tropicibacter naphthalenivorans]CUH82668.1 Alkyl hydroperoxide reductase subunit C [Tropicibacter naphthalenivorans]SMD11351.1 1-Cys peroxiredoxin [Tropicibacter naphthalenivorans]